MHVVEGFCAGLACWRLHDSSAPMQVMPRHLQVIEETAQGPNGAWCGRNVCSDRWDVFAFCLDSNVFQL